MALANFFDKAALAAAQVLQGVDYEHVADMLEHEVVGLAFDDQAMHSSEGRETLALSINLLARLYPHLGIIPLGKHAQTYAQHLAKIADAINPGIVIDDDASHVSALLVVGATAGPAGVPTIYIGSDGWIVRVSPDAPTGSGTTHNPCGAGAAACFGAANIFRIIFRKYLPHATVDQAFAMSLLDYQPNASELRNPPLTPIDLGETHLVGAGAIGNGTLWALSRTPQLRGRLHIIDHEDIELTNLQRYVLAFQADIGTSKVLLADRLFHDTTIKCQPHAERWGEYLRTRGNWYLQRVAVAVDSDEDRRAIQAALPLWIANAWTQIGDLGISRHTLLGDRACLMCLYLPDQDRPSADQVVAEAIGLPEAREEVRYLLYTGSPVTRALLERAAAALRVPLEPLLLFEGQPLRSFYTQAICGGVVLRLGGTQGNAHQAEAVPLAFQSALAGIMLAAEIIAHAGNVKAGPLPVATKIDLLRPLPVYLSYPARKHPSGRCICQDADYVAAYQTKYNHVL